MSEAPQDPNAATRSFRVTAFPTIDPGIEDRWARSIGIQAPHFRQATALHPGQPCTLLVLFTGYGVDPHMMADVQFSWKLHTPDGKKLLGATALDGIKGRVLHGDFVMRPREPIAFSFPAKAQPGTYTITVHAHCRIARKKASATIDLSLAPLTWDSPFDGPDAIAAWIDAYTHAPSPGHLIPAYLQLFDTLGRDNPDAFFTQLAFCAEVLRLNPWLAPATEERWAQRGPRHRAALSLLWHAARLDSNLPELKALIADRAKAPFPSAAELLARPITHPQELDMVWAIYRASGRFAAFRKACAAIAPLPEAFRAVTTEEQAEQVAKAAAWSVDQHLSRHDDSLAYAMALFKEEGMDERVALCLQGILARRGWIPNPDYQG